MENDSDGPPFARLREFWVHDLPNELVLRGRDCAEPSYHQFLVIKKLKSTDASVTPSSRLTSASGQDTPSTYHTSSLSEEESFTQILSTAIVSGATGEKTCEYNPLYHGHNDDNSTTNDAFPVIHFSEFRLSASSAKDLTATLKRLSSGRRVLKAFGLLGCIRFLHGYYILLIVAKSHVASLGNRKIYSIDDITAVPCFSGSQADLNLMVWNLTSDAGYLRLIQRLFSSMRSFFFSYEWDLTRTLQQQSEDAPLSGLTSIPLVPQNIMESNSYQYQHKSPPAITCDSRFVFNAFLLRPLLENPSASPLHWLLPIVQGSVEQDIIRIGSRTFSITVIARRSRYHAGPRYFKRGVNEQGRVANEVECEQILWELQSIQVPQYKMAVMGLGSIVMVRGSIPVFWGHEDSSSIKPKLKMQLKLDPYFTRTKVHFDDLITRYGSPVVVLNLVKGSPRYHPEVELASAYENAISTIQAGYWRSASKLLTRKRSKNETKEDNESRLCLDPTGYRTSKHNRISGDQHQYHRCDDDDSSDDNDTCITPEVEYSGWNGSSREEDDDHSEFLPRANMSGISRLGSRRNTNEVEELINEGKRLRKGIKQIRYIPFDWANEDRTVGFETALRKLFTMGGSILDDTGFNVQQFKSSIPPLKWESLESSPTLQQMGVPRINCVDCLDRTNLGMLAIAQEALRRQLILLGCSFSRSNIRDRITIANETKTIEEITVPPIGIVSPSGKRLTPSSSSSSNYPCVDHTRHNDAWNFNLPADVLRQVSELWGAVGDEIAIAYAGSAAMHRADIIPEIQGGDTSTTSSLCCGTCCTMTNRDEELKIPSKTMLSDQSHHCENTSMCLSSLNSSQQHKRSQQQQTFEAQHDLLNLSHDRRLVLPGSYSTSPPREMLAFCFGKSRSLPTQSMTSTPTYELQEFIDACLPLMNTALFRAIQSQSVKVTQSQPTKEEEYLGEQKSGQSPQKFKTQQQDVTAWKAKKRSNVSIAVQRYIHNVFGDLDRQRALDLLLGKFRPRQGQPSIWEVELFPSSESNIEQDTLKGSKTRLTTGYHTHTERFTSSIPSTTLQSSSPHCCVTRNGDAVFGWVLNMCGVAKSIEREEDTEIEIPAVTVQHPIDVMQTQRMRTLTLD